MGNLRPVGRAVSFQLRYEILVGPVISGGNEDEGLDGPSHRITLVQFGKRVDEDIDPFVPVLVPSADTNQDGILRDFFTGHGCGYFQEFPTGCDALIIIFRVRRGCKAVLESVGRHDSNFPFQKMGAFLSSISLTVVKASAFPAEFSRWNAGLPHPIALPFHLRRTNPSHHKEAGCFRPGIDRSR